MIVTGRVDGTRTISVRSARYALINPATLSVSAITVARAVHFRFDFARPRLRVLPRVKIAPDRLVAVAPDQRPPSFIDSENACHSEVLSRLTLYHFSIREVVCEGDLSYRLVTK